MKLYEAEMAGGGVEGTEGTERRQDINRIPSPPAAEQRRALFNAEADTEGT